MIFTSPHPPVEIPDVALTPYVLQRVAEIPDRAAFIEGPTGRVVTYAELADAIRRQAGGWLTRGLEPGEVVALMAPNCPEYGVTFHGVALAGGVVTTINPTYTSHEVHHQLNDSGATRMVVHAMFHDTATAAADGTGVRQIYVIGDAPAGSQSLASVTADPLTEQVGGAPDDLVALPYSSGTTGLSKGVMLTQRNLVANTAQTITAAGFRDGERYVGVLPFFHIYGMSILMNTGLATGATIVTMPRFDLAEFLRLHQEHHLTMAFVAPPMVVALAKHPIVDEYDLSSLRLIFSGAAPLSAELAAECAARLDCDVVQGYGMTELSPLSHATSVDGPGGFKPGSVGVTAALTESRIVDPATGEDGNIDDIGELWVRGPQVMRGYLNNDAATSTTIDADGWLHTGDIARIDADGHVFIVDRLKELIKYKGFQVPPAELEALLLTHPDVADAAVIGLPDEESGEIPAAYVVLKEGRDVAAEDLQSYVAERTAHYKHIRRLTFLPAIPKSPSGKILRRVLRDEAVST